MKREHVFFLFVLFFSLLSFYLFYRILSPFLESLLWALLLAMIFYPVYRRLKTIFKKSNGIPALIMTFLVLLVIISPLGLLVFSLAQDLVSAYHFMEEMVETGKFQAYVEEATKTPFIALILERFKSVPGFSGMEPLDLLLKNLKQISAFLFEQSSRILRSLSTFFFGFVIMLLSLYYLFKDGEGLLGYLKRVVPVPSREKDLLLRRFREMINATFYGGILIAILQGILGGLAFWILDLPSPVIWGTAMALFSFVPIGGTALIWIPASLILVVTGSYLKAIALAAIGTFLIGMVDNFLRPIFISSRTRIHPLLLLFSVLGGMQIFGLVGLFLGPLIATLSLTLVEIYIQGSKPGA